MAHYIDADQLKAEIKGIIKALKVKKRPNESESIVQCIEQCMFEGEIEALNIALDFIKGLQQKQQEVDLETEYQEFCKDNPFPWSSQYVNREYIDELCLSVARHFYELGRKAKEDK